MHGLLRCFAPALDSSPSFLVESGGVEAIVQGMIAHARDKQATQFSLEVHHCPPLFASSAPRHTIILHYPRP